MTTYGDFLRDEGFSLSSPNESTSKQSDAYRDMRSKVRRATLKFLGENGPFLAHEARAELWNEFYVFSLYGTFERYFDFRSYEDNFWKTGNAAELYEENTGSTPERGKVWTVVYLKDHEDSDVLKEYLRRRCS